MAKLEDGIANRIALNRYRDAVALGAEIAEPLFEHALDDNSRVVAFGAQFRAGKFNPGCDSCTAPGERVEKDPLFHCVSVNVIDPRDAPGRRAHSDYTV